MFIGLGYRWLKAQRERIPFDFRFFGGYLACVAALIAIHRMTAGNEPEIRFTHVAAWVITALFFLKLPLLALACIPFRLWIRMLRETRPLWLYAALAGVAAWFLVHPSQSLWRSSSAEVGQAVQIATFDTVQAVLGLVLPDSASDASSFTVGTPRFSVLIWPSCSGMEGMGLILAFTIVWLLYLRRQLRFPRALLLIPCALACIWLMNVLRISALILIGTLVSEEVAMVGFHSQAGWISFTLVALGFSLYTQRLRWLQKAPARGLSVQGGRLEARVESVPCASAEAEESSGESPAIRAYLLPFLAILAAAFLSKSVSGHFEWAYPLRFFAAAFAILYLLPELKKLDWRFGWVAPAAGAAVFLLWIAPAWLARMGWVHSSATSLTGLSLGALSPAARWSWIGFRVAAAVITVPIAEELAFRGYLARRLMDREFDRVSFSGLTPLAIAISSAVFGLEHMKDLFDWQHMILGTLAGVAFAAVLRWRGRMGDAAVAHAVCNLLLAAWVLGLGDWAQW